MTVLPLSGGARLLLGENNSFALPGLLHIALLPMTWAMAALFDRFEAVLTQTYWGLFSLINLSNSSFRAR